MKKNNSYYKFLILFLIFFSMLFFLTKNMDNIVKSTPYKNYMDFVSIPFNFLNDYNVFKYKNLVKENKKLSEEVLTFNMDSVAVKSLKEENEKLRKLLELRSTYSNYNYVFSKTINRNKMYWFNTITIDKGRAHGIKSGNLVIAQDSLIGVIESAGKHSSTVKLITNSNNNLSVKVKNRSLKYGIISGYSYPYLKVELSEDAKNVKIGDEIITSGLGDLPKNIAVGKVSKIERDSYEYTYILYVKPYQDINDIDYVMVLIK